MHQYYVPGFLLSFSRHLNYYIANAIQKIVATVVSLIGMAMTVVLEIAVEVSPLFSFLYLAYQCRVRLFQRYLTCPFHYRTIAQGLFCFLACVYLSTAGI